MKNLFRLFTLAVLLTISASFINQVQAQGEVTRSGSTWTAKVNGSTVYTGSRMFDAVNAACNNMGSGTINIRNSGDSGEDGGNVYAIRPLSGQILDFNGTTVNCNSSGDLAVAVYADRKSNITVRNINVTGNPRYAFWFRGCSNITFTNITMNLSNNSPVGLGIRVDASTAASSNLTINGNININGSAGHAIETYSVNGVNIGNVTATNTGGCGVLLNDSENCTVGVVTGNYNCPNGGYATFRVANSNGTTYCAGVYSRNSGRGFFSVTESSNCTVEWVDIANTYSQCIYIQDSYNTHVLHGKTSNCGADNLIRGGSGNSINLDGQTSGGSTTNNGTINGTYSIIASHSSKAVDTYNWGTTNGTNIAQWSYWGGDAQKFNITPVDGIWHRITPIISTGQALDVNEVSTADGANIQTWEYWGGYGQQFRFQSAGTGVWRIINRNSEKCLDVEGSSSADGANILQWTCISGAANQMFSLVNASGRMAGGQSLEELQSELKTYPNPVKDVLNITMPENFGRADIKLIQASGNIVLSTTVEARELSLDVSSLATGFYVLTLDSDKGNIKRKIVIE